MANFLTFLRIVFSAGIAFCRPISPLFYVLYILAGLSDVLDGPIARKTGTATDAGAKLDTVADSVFFGTCLVKLFPIIPVPFWALCWAGVIAAVKIPCFIIAAHKHFGFGGFHAPYTRASGLLIYALPLCFRLIGIALACAAVCVVASVGAAYDVRFIAKELRRVPNRPKDRKG